MTRPYLNRCSPVSRGLAQLASGGVACLAPTAGGHGLMLAAADCVEAPTVALLAREARGPISVVMSPRRRERFGIPDMPGCLRPMTVEAAAGISTGISAADRALTLRLAAQWPPCPEALRHPGHVSVEVVDPGLGSGQGDPPGLALAAIHLAGRGCAVIATILSFEGEIATEQQVRRLATRLGMPCFAAADLRAYVTLAEQVRLAS